MSESRLGNFNNWYAKNATDFNDKRRRRYQEDPEVRAKARARAAEYRVAYAGSVPEPRDGFSTSARVAAELGISPQTLRNWETRYLIPKATFGSQHRLYNDHQILLLKAMVVQKTGSEEFQQARRNMFLYWNAG